jgi:SulP family sulfate permease
MQELREMGWLFTLPSATESPFWLFWTFYDFNVVDWSAIAKTLPTQFALTFFGILHVPINGNLIFNYVSPGIINIHSTRC